MARMRGEFKEILEKIPEDKRLIGGKLIAELTFMQDTLSDLRKQVKEGGTIENFSQGKQNFQRESPALKAYNTTVQRYSVMYRQLTDLIQKSAEPEKSNAIYDFLKATKGA